jgi:hypothetical protein
MFYTGGGSREHGLKQRVGLANSADLHHWTKHPASPVLESDPRWYESVYSVGELIDPVPVGWAQDGTTLVEQFPAGPRRERGRPPSPFLY